MMTRPPIDHSRRVFSVPVTYTVTTTLSVLARDLSEARKRAHDTDLNDLVGFDTDQMWIDFVDILKIEDVHPTDINLVAIKPVDPADYDPKDHPDWAPVGES